MIEADGEVTVSFEKSALPCDAAASEAVSNMTDEALFETIGDVILTAAKV